MPCRCILLLSCVPPVPDSGQVIHHCRSHHRTACTVSLFSDHQLHGRSYPKPFHIFSSPLSNLQSPPLSSYHSLEYREDVNIAQYQKYGMNLVPTQDHSLSKSLTNLTPGTKIGQHRHVLINTVKARSRCAGVNARKGTHMAGLVHFVGWSHADSLARKFI